MIGHPTHGGRLEEVIRRLGAKSAIAAVGLLTVCVSDGELAVGYYDNLAGEYAAPQAGYSEHNQGTAIVLCGVPTCVRILVCD